MTDRFDTCLPFTLAQECPYPNDWSNPRNFSNDAHDPGGETMCGITQREYDIWRKREGLPVQDVKLITRTEGYDIYMGSYWVPHCAALLPGLDLQFFDASVNEGPVEATRILQYVLGIARDGIWGPVTSAHVKAIPDVELAIRAFTERREAVYREMSGFPYFGNGWLKRSAEIGAEALEMAGQAVAGTAPAKQEDSVWVTLWQRLSGLYRRSRSWLRSRFQSLSLFFRRWLRSIHFCLFSR